MTDFITEYARAKAKYPDALWCGITRLGMMWALLKEVWELAKALSCGDIHGKHGVLTEAIHVQVVAKRIAEEMARRHGTCKPIN